MSLLKLTWQPAKLTPCVCFSGVPPAPVVPVVSHNPVIALYGEYLQCPQHREVILCLSSILQSITVRCPGSLVWHDFGEGKTSSVLSGSPLDLLTFSPSCLPMPPRADNQKVSGVFEFFGWDGDGGVGRGYQWGLVLSFVKLSSGVNGTRRDGQWCWRGNGILKGGCQLLCPEVAEQQFVMGSLLSRLWES